jgi:hypothetical protein
MPFDGGYYVSDPVVKRLREAQERLIEHGWVRGYLHSGYVGTYCIIGAVIDARYDAPIENMAKILFGRVDNRAFFYLKRTIGVRGFTRWKGIMKWNDKIVSNKDEVIRKFDEAIEMRISQMMTACE